MSRIRTTLLLAMLAVVIVTIGTSAFMTRRVTHEELKRVMVAVRPRSVNLGAIEQYHREHGTWSGVEKVLDDLGRSIVMTDADHRVIAVSKDLRDATVRVGGDTVDVRGKRMRITVMLPPMLIDGARVYILPQPVRLDPLAVATLDRRLITSFAAATFVALLLTFLVSRQITRPIERLNAAVETMTRGETPAHVDASGQGEIAQLARSFNRMSDAVATQHELRRRMVVDVAHELRTPLTNLRCELEAIQDGLASPNIASLHEEVLHLGRLVDDLQELAVAEAGGLQLQRARIDLGETVERAVELFRAEGERRGMRLSVGGDGASPHPGSADPLPAGEGARRAGEGLFVDADPTRIRQVVRNLVANAMQNTPDGGRIDVRVARDGANAIVSVSDEGRGIPADQLEKIFERFYRVDESRNRDSGGAGLGLAIVRRLVETHGGRVWAESEGRGATFTFTLPLSS